MIDKKQIGSLGVSIAMKWHVSMAMRIDQDKKAMVMATSEVNMAVMYSQEGRKN